MYHGEDFSNVEELTHAIEDYIQWYKTGLRVKKCVRNRGFSRIDL